MDSPINIDANVVITRLRNHLQEATYSVILLEAQVDMLTAQIAQLSAKQPCDCEDEVAKPD